MKTLKTLLAILLLSGGCTTVKPRPPVVIPPPDPPPVTVPVTIHNLTLRVNPDLAVKATIVDSVNAGRTAESTTGNITLDNLTDSDFNYCVEAPAHERQCAGIALYNEDATREFTLNRIIVDLTEDDLLHVRASLANVRDPEGNAVWGSALPGAPPDKFEQWLSLLVQSKATHVITGPFEAGPAYTGVPFNNPDWTHDPLALRAYLDRIIAHPGADGKPFRILFFFSGGPLKKVWVDEQFPIYAKALEGLEKYVILVPCWECVVGDATTAEMGYALETGHRLFPNFTWFVHLSPMRGTWASNPVEPDDPFKYWVNDTREAGGGHWETCESCAWTHPRYDFVKGFLYQTEHGRPLYNWGCHISDGDACWLDRWNDMVQRLGAGERGWPRRVLVLFETVAYEYFRGQTTDEDAIRIANLGKQVCDSWGVTCYFGNGQPGH